MVTREDQQKITHIYSDKGASVTSRADKTTTEFTEDRNVQVRIITGGKIETV